MAELQFEPRLTHATVSVLQVLLADPERDVYGLEVCTSAGLPTGTVHPIMVRLLAGGWLDSYWEEGDPKGRGRPLRRYYRLSGEGRARARDAVERAGEKAERLRARGKGERR